MLLTTLSYATTKPRNWRPRPVHMETFPASEMSYPHLSIYNGDIPNGEHLTLLPQQFLLLARLRWQDSTLSSILIEDMSVNILELTTPTNKKSSRKLLERERPLHLQLPVTWKTSWYLFASSHFAYFRLMVISLMESI